MDAEHRRWNVPHIRAARGLSILAALLCMALASPDDYRIISENKAEITLLKPSTLGKSGAFDSVWIVALRAPGREAAGASVFHIKQEIDCKGQRLRALSIALYARDNTFINSHDYEPGERPWITITPDSQGEQVARYVCGGEEERNKHPILAGLSLAQIVTSTFSGEWPGK